MKTFKRFFFSKFHDDNHSCLYDQKILVWVIWSNLSRWNPPVWKHHRFSYTHKWAWRLV